MKIESFEDLRVWQAGIELVKQIYLVRKEEELRGVKGKGERLKEHASHPSFTPSPFPLPLSPHNCQVLYNRSTMQQKLLTQIATVLKSRSEISLPELITIYPIDCGMEEVVAYLEIAQQPPHTIDNEVKDSIEVSNVLQDSQMKTTVPRIVFHR